MSSVNDFGFHADSTSPTGVARPSFAAMLAPHAEAIREAKIVLASSSPRRVEILNQILRLDARVVASTFPEDLDKSAYTPSEYVMANARAKALEVHQRLLASEGSSPSLVIGADTVISHAGKLLESPKAMSALGLGDAETIAKQTLQTLSGQSHTICTGVALIYAAEGSGEPYVETFVEQTEVEFCSLSSEVIDAYVATGEPIDKAGVCVSTCSVSACDASFDQ